MVKCHFKMLKPLDMLTKFIESYNTVNTKSKIYQEISFFE
jgi:hypothetical protein